MIKTGETSLYAENVARYCMHQRFWVIL